MMDTRKADWKIRCVIYDCDGVLFDSLEANTRLYNDLCARVGRGPLIKEELGYVHTHTVFEALHFIFGQEDEMERKALELLRLKEIDLREYVAYLKMEPHLIQTLETLQKKGILRVINTNRTTSMKYIMEKFNLWPYFERVVTALDVKNPKPHPESIEKILQEFNLRKKEAVFVGDSDVDQQTAKSSGIKFIAYKNKEIANDAYIEDHLGLLSMVLSPKDFQR